MSLRTRRYIVLVITVLAAVIYSLLTRGWSDVAFYGGAAGVLAVIVFAGMPWLELAPDGAWRRRPEA